MLPDLAQSWTISPDQTTYTFTLRPGAEFADGTPVTSADVQFSIERACDPATGSTVAATYLGDIVGCLDKLAGKATLVSGISVPDRETVVFHIDQPKSYFLAKLTYSTAFVVQALHVKGSGRAVARQPTRFAPAPSCSRRTSRASRSR